MANVVEMVEEFLFCTYNDIWDLSKERSRRKPFKQRKGIKCE